MRAQLGNIDNPAVLDVGTLKLDGRVTVALPGSDVMTSLLSDASSVLLAMRDETGKGVSPPNARLVCPDGGGIVRVDSANNHWAGYVIVSTAVSDGAHSNLKWGFADRDVTITGKTGKDGNGAD